MERSGAPRSTRSRFRNAGRFGIAVAVLWLSCEALPAADAARPEDKLRLTVAAGVEFVVESNVPVSRLEGLAAHARSVQEQLVETLQVPPLEQPLRIYLFDSQASFSKHVRQWIPSVRLTDTLVRHGLFLLRDGRPYVFVVDQAELVPSLRHEVVHAVLNASHPALPIWIDEGLAQCFEDPQGSFWNRRAADVLTGDFLRRSVPAPRDLSRLERMQQLGPREYAASWASMYYLLNNAQTGRPALVHYLAGLRQGKTEISLLEALRDFPRSRDAWRHP